MSAPYISVPITGYNANPPADDGSAVSTNQVKWSTIKTKLDDPLNTAILAMNSGILAAFANTLAGGSIVSTGVNIAVTNSNQGDLMRATAAGITITAPDATSVGSPFTWAILNSSTGNITLAGPIVATVQQLINGSASITLAAGDGYEVFTDGTNWYVVGRKTGTLPRSYGSGCKAANGADTTNDITFTAGKWRDSTDTVDLTVPAFSTGKQLDANWAPGDAAGCRNSAAGIANATYHYYAVGKADGSNADIYAVAGVAGTDPESTASYAAVITALQLESGGTLYVYARRIFSIPRLSAALVQFTHSGDYTRPKTPIQDVDTAVLTTSASTQTMASVPVGLAMLIKANVTVGAAAGAEVYIKATGDTDSAPSQTAAPGASAGINLGNTMNAQVDIWIDASAQFTARSTAASTTFKASAVWWLDTRGRYL